MAKLTYWLMAVILLCQFGWNIPTGNIHPEYRSMGNDAGKIILFLLYVAISEYGKKLDKGYKCPLYCGVDHKHILWEYDEVKSNQKSNLSPVNGIYHGIRDTVKEQSGSSIRPIAGIN
jgi:hypothetical protein